MNNGPASVAELDRLESVIDAWLDCQVTENPVVVAAERDRPGSRRWFVRVKGEEKDVYTVRFHLRQRTLYYESHFMPAPAENHRELYAQLLARNLKMYGGSFAIGEEEAIMLQGHLDRSMITAEELDRVLGSLYAWVEQYFKPALRVGFASRFL